MTFGATQTLGEEEASLTCVETGAIRAVMGRRQDIRQGSEKSETATLARNKDQGVT